MGKVNFPNRMKVQLGQIWRRTAGIAVTIQFVFGEGTIENSCKQPLRNPLTRNVTFGASESRTYQSAESTHDDSRFTSKGAGTDHRMNLKVNTVL